MCDIFLCYDDKLYIFVSQNRTILRQLGFCVWKGDVFLPKIGHSEAHNNSKNTHWGIKCEGNNFVTYGKIKSNIKSHIQVK